ncbi:MAG: PQQ-binding-like beta-propeller repeat protein [Gemmataceae bacterium]|nr:PQQ-binding-like beta-propeller repeat protein [Gemmataceae bacterium]
MSLLPSFLLCTLLGGDADEVQLRAAGVATDGPGLVKFLRSFTPADIDPASVGKLIQGLGSDEFDEREACVKRLIVLGPQALPYLRQAIRDPDRERALRAENCLKVIDAGPGANAHGAVLRLIAKLKPDGAAAALLDYLPYTPNEKLLEESYTALAAVAQVKGEPDPAFFAALRSKLPNQRAAAALALAQSGRLDPATKLLADPDAMVRYRLALALAPLKVKEAVPALIDVMDVLPPAQHGPIEAILFRLAGDKIPQPANPAAWKKWWQANADKIDLARLTDQAVLLGLTIIASATENAVREIDPAGKLRWEMNDVNYPMAIQRLASGNILIAEYRGRRITERRTNGEIVWQYAVAMPLAAQRLANGNTFVATRTQLLEVDQKGQVVFKATTGNVVMAAKKLPNGHIVCLSTGGIVLRMDENGKETARFPAGFGVNFGVGFDLTPKGNLLIPQAARNKIVEFSATGKVEREIDFQAPDSVSYLANGNLLVTSQNMGRVAEIDARGRVVWEHRVTTPGPLKALRR